MSIFLIDIAISILTEPVAPVWVGAKKFSMKDRYETTVMSSEQISKILPHRYPFLLVDRVVEFEAGKIDHSSLLSFSSSPYFMDAIEPATHVSKNNCPLDKLNSFSHL